MRYIIAISEEALQDLKDLRAHERARVLDLMERVLSTDPAQTSRSRIKRLRGVDRPQFRLRVDDYRVFYDVAGAQVQVLRILEKRKSVDYLREMGYEPENG